jgi:hypothetical protein
MFLSASGPVEGILFENHDLSLKIALSSSGESFHVLSLHNTSILITSALSVPSHQGAYTCFAAPFLQL